MNTIIGIDQSLTGTGVSVLKKNKVSYSDVIKTADMRGMERLDYICKSLVKIIEEQTSLGEEIIVVREGYSYGSFKSSSVFELGELGGIIDMMFYHSDRKVSLYVLPPTLWKLMVFGCGNVKKDTQYLLKAYDVTGIKFSDDNIADSYMLIQGFLKICGETIVLNKEQRFSLISPSLRKKHKLTKANISKSSDELIKQLILDTINGLRKF